MKNRKVNRRSFLHKIVGITALGGIASLILGQKVEKVRGLDGTGSANQIAYWFDSDTITGGSDLKFLTTIASLQVGNNCTASGQYSAVCGGENNNATGSRSNVGGGKNNNASGWYSTISGGQDNDASGSSSAVGGGYNNKASGSGSSISGGYTNTASADYSTVSGGYSNYATGLYSTVIGGFVNKAEGDYSLAAGRHAEIHPNHEGTFLFADSTNADFNSARAKEFAVRCTNGARFIAGSSYPAVKGENSGSGQGIYGKSTSGTGVKGESSNSAEYGVSGINSSGTGVYGETSSSNPAIKGNNTGSGNGLHGESNGGNGIYAKSTSGAALHVEGKSYFKSAQRATIPTGVRSHDITVPSGITIRSDAMIFVTIMNNSSNIGVRWVQRLSSDEFRVHLTGLSSNDMNIGYFIVN
ncbi:MAG: hypothetical protein NWF08_04100 [Candidatus Bathyarchaeota archaeon]|nr:hypothetical protein [Candidatus Bathyarchaeota archaeon]